MIPARHANLPLLPNDIEEIEAVGKAAERAAEAVEDGKVLLSPRRRTSFDLSQANFVAGIDDADTPEQVGRPRWSHFVLGHIDHAGQTPPPPPPPSLSPSLLALGC